MDFNRLRFIKRKEVNNIIAFINTIIKIRYNNIYNFININEGVLIYLRLYYNYFIFNINLKLFN